MVKLKAPVHGGRNNAVYVGQGVRQACTRGPHVPYTLRRSPRRIEKSSAVVLSPRSSIRLFQCTLAAREKGIATPVMKLAQEFNQSRSTVYKKFVNAKKTGSVHDGRKVNPGRPVVFGQEFEDFIVQQVEKGRNHKPHPYVASGPMIVKAMIKSKRFKIVPTSVTINVWKRKSAHLEEDQGRRVEGRDQEALSAA
jgi:hypothetical protein